MSLQLTDKILNLEVENSSTKTCFSSNISKCNCASLKYIEILLYLTREYLLQQ